MKKLTLALLYLLGTAMAMAQAGPQIPLSGSIGVPGSAPTLCSAAVAMPSDADFTLSANQAACNSLYVTSSVSLTATRNIVAPLNYGQQFSVTNATTGGQSIQLIGASGSGVIIASGQTQIVNSPNGTNYVGASAALPNATTGGQIITSTAAGTTYAVQGRIFYAQSGDTIASIETECSSLCTYIVTTPQTLTLSADHVLNANVCVVWDAGGEWTFSGAHNFTFSCKPQGPPTQHLAGNATILGLSGAVPFEWFGVQGFTTKSAAAGGSDYSTQGNACLGSLTGGGWCQLQALYYNFTSGLTITTSSVGIQGLLPRDSSNPAGTDAHVSSIISTAATGTVVDVHGTSSVFIVWNQFKNFAIERTTQPTGTSATGSIGISLQYVGGATLDTITVNDSLDGFYFNGAPSFSSGHYTRLSCSNGFLTVNSYSAGQNINCADIDSSNGVAMNSGEFYQVGGAIANTALSATSTAVNIHGTRINDVDIDHAFSSGTNYGLQIVYTGGGAGDTDADIHFNAPTFDNCTTSCVLISGLPTTGGSSVIVQSGYLETNTTSAKIVDIESSHGVSILGNQIFALFSGGGNTGIFVNASSNNIFNNNNIQNLSGGTGISCVSSSIDNTIVGNNLWEGIATGLNFDNSSLANDVGLNSFDSTVSLPVSGVPAGSVGSNIYTRTLTIGPAVPGIGGSVNGNINFGNNFGAAALTLYDGGAGNSYGWGINSQEMQFFISSSPTTDHFSWNGGGSFQSSGTNELMRLFATGHLSIGTTTDCGTLLGIGSGCPFTVDASGNLKTPSASVLNSTGTNDLAIFDNNSGHLADSGVVIGNIPQTVMNNTWTGTNNFYNAVTNFGQVNAATSGANHDSSQVDWQGTFWNGSASAPDAWNVVDNLGTGTNPTSTLRYSHTGSTGGAAVAVPAIGTTVYTVSTLPTASTLPAGTQVVVSDGAGTPPTCTGSGSNYQIALTNGSTWSCH